MFNAEEGGTGSEGGVGWNNEMQFNDALHKEWLLDAHRPRSISMLYRSYVQLFLISTQGEIEKEMDGNCRNLRIINISVSVQGRFLEDGDWLGV